MEVKTAGYRRNVYNAQRKRFMAAGIGAGIANAARHLYSSMSKKAKVEGPSTAITTQRDSRTLYRRRRAPRKVRRRARKNYISFIKKQLKAQNDKTNMFYINASYASAAGLQSIHSITFGYLFNKTTADQVGNVYDFWQNYLNSLPETASQRLYITGMSYDITLSNVTPNEGTDAQAIELDVYEFVFRKDHESDQSGGVAGELGEALTNEQKLPGATTAMTTSLVGYVPFDSNQFMRYIVIRSKQRYYIPRGDSVSFTKNIRFRRPIMVTSEDVDANNGTYLNRAKSGLTRGLILIQKGTADYNGTVSVGASNLISNTQCRYKFKVINKDPNQNAVGT